MENGARSELRRRRDRRRACRLGPRLGPRAGRPARRGARRGRRRLSRLARQFRAGLGPEKGLGMPEYAGWSKRSSDLWTGFAAELKEASGFDVAYQRPGGFQSRPLGARARGAGGSPQEPAQPAEHGRYDYEVLDHAGSPRGSADWPRGGRRHLIARSTATATRCASCAPSTAISSAAAASICRTTSSRRSSIAMAASVSPAVAAQIEAGKVVLAAGNGNARLAPLVGLRAPVRPQRGQILVTEKLAPFLNYIVQPSARPTRAPSCSATRRGGRLRRSVGARRRGDWPIARCGCFRCCAASMSCAPGRRCAS